jgi:hypothetical protein
MINDYDIRLTNGYYNYQIERLDVKTNIDIEGTALPGRIDLFFFPIIQIEEAESKRLY